MSVLDRLIMNYALAEGYSESMDHHWHKCPRCGTRWDHKTSEIPDDGTSRAFDLAHTCPVPGCGVTDCTWKYVTEEEAARA